MSKSAWTLRIITESKTQRIRHNRKGIKMEEFSREELTHKLKEAEDRAAYYRRIIEYAPDGIYITDGDANAVLINPAFERISGLERDKLIGKNHRELEKKRIIK